MTPEEQTARHNCLLRGREIERGLPEPPLSTARDALLAFWRAVPEEDRLAVNLDCQVQDGAPAT